MSSFPGQILSLFQLGPQSTNERRGILSNHKALFQTRRDDSTVLYGGVDVVSDLSEDEIDTGVSIDNDPVLRKHKVSLSSISDASTGDAMDTERNTCFTKGTVTVFALYIIAFANCMLRISAAVSSQIIKSIIPSMQLNFIRFAALFVTGSISIAIRRSTPTLNYRSDYYRVILGGLAMLIYMWTFYESVHYAPIGNMLVATTLSALLTFTVIQFCSKKHCLVAATITISISSIGLLLLAQPTIIFKDVSGQTTDTLDTHQINSTRGIQNKVENMLTSSESPVCSLHVTSLEDLQEWKGYLYALIAGICFTVLGMIVDELKSQENKCEVILFWLGFIGGAIALIAFVVTEKSMVFITQNYCMLFTAFHILAAVAHPAISLALHQQVPDDHMTLIWVISMTSPFLGQSSYLSGYIPYTWNIYGFIGVSFVFIPLIMLQIWNIWGRDKIFSKNRDNVDLKSKQCRFVENNESNNSKKQNDETRGNMDNSTEGQWFKIKTLLRKKCLPWTESNKWHKKLGLGETSSK